MVKMLKNKDTISGCSEVQYICVIVLDLQWLYWLSIMQCYTYCDSHDT